MEQAYAQALWKLIQEGDKPKEAVEKISTILLSAEKKDTKLADMALVARMVAVSALRRTESRGGHCRSDYPKPMKAWQKRTFITLKEIEALSAGKKLECVA